MRYSLIAILLAFTVVGCSQSTAGLTLQANESFLLGEYERTEYTAKLKNKGPQTVQVEVLDKETGAVASNLNLEPRAKDKVRVTARQMVRIINDSNIQADILVEMSTTVQGMRMMARDEALPLTTERPSAKKTTADQERIANTKVDIPANSRLIFGKGNTSAYTVDLKISAGAGDMIVSVRSTKSGEQTQGFGLARFGKATVHIRNNEYLTMENTGGKAGKVSLALTRDISGVRTESL